MPLSHAALITLIIFAGIATIGTCKLSVQYNLPTQDREFWDSISAKFFFAEEAGTGGVIYMLLRYWIWEDDGERVGDGLVA